MREPAEGQQLHPRRLRHSSVMTDANEAIQPVHDRMPVLLMPDEYERWLRGSLNDVVVFQQRVLHKHRAHSSVRWLVVLSKEQLDKADQPTNRSDLLNDVPDLSNDGARRFDEVCEPAQHFRCVFCERAGLIPEPIKRASLDGSSSKPRHHFS